MYKLHNLKISGSNPLIENKDQEREEQNFEGLS